jgi:hypothetical protein
MRWISSIVEAILSDQAILAALIGAVGAAAVLIALIVFRGPVKCEKCGAEQPKVRPPETLEQMMWGGYTCKTCGSQINARGRVKKT